VNHELAFLEGELLDVARLAAVSDTKSSLKCERPWPPVTDVQK
jgi:hypothetical protein